MPRHARPISGFTFAFPRASAVSSRPTAEPLAALAEVLRARGTRWYLFGAQAVIIWGAPRMSADIDVTVDLGLDQIEVGTMS
jgi:hypothetical protein